MTQPSKLSLIFPAAATKPCRPASLANWHKSWESHDKLCGSVCADFGKRIKPRIIRQNKSGNLDVLIVGEAPGADEIAKGEAFMGEGGKFLDAIIQKALPTHNILLDNAFAHNTGNYDIVNGEMLTSCGVRLQAMVRDLKPKVVIMMGESAIRAFGVETKVLSACGDVYPIYRPDGGITWGICSVAPNYVLRTPYEMYHLANVFDKTRTLCDPDDDFVVAECKDFEALLKKTSGILRSFDIETQGKIPHKGGMLLFSVGWRTKKGLRAEYYKGPIIESQRKKLGKWMCDGGTSIMHNANYEQSWVKPPKIPLLHDTYIRHWMINENEGRGLDHLAVRYARMQPYWHNLPEDASNYIEADQDELGYYCSCDCIGTYRLFEWQENKLTDKQKAYLYRFGNPFTNVLWRMEENGVKVNRQAAIDLDARLEREVEALEAEVAKRWPGINWRSPDQVRKLLFEDLKLQPVNMTAKSGKWSTDKETMEVLAKQYPDLKLVVKIKQKGSKRGRIVKPLIVKSERDGLIHTSWNYGLVATGRLSSSDPNLQNIERQDDPKNPEFDISLGEEKNCFESRFPGGKLVKADYGQFELLLSVIYARDRVFKGYFDKGLDPHTETAKVHKVERQTGKKINLSMVSGISPRGLEYEYGIPLADAERFHKLFFKTHPDIDAYHRGLAAKIVRDGYVENLVGRRRHIPYAKAEEWPLVARAKKQAKNFPIQGGAADIIAAAIVRIDEELTKRKMQSLLVMQIHDEIVVDTHPSELKAVQTIMEKYMLNPFDEPFYVPLRVEFSIGDTLWK